MHCAPTSGCLTTPPICDRAAGDREADPVMMAGHKQKPFAQVGTMNIFADFHARVAAILLRFTKAGRLPADLDRLTNL